MAGFDDLIKKSEEDAKTIEWCDECSKWHHVGALTMCLLRKGKRMMMDEPEPQGPFLPNPKRPWERKK